MMMVQRSTQSSSPAPQKANNNIQNDFKGNKRLTSMRQRYCSSNYSTRTRLLNRLGIFNEVSQKRDLTSTSSLGPAIRRGRNDTQRPLLLRTIKPLQASLNDCVVFSSKSSSSSSSSTVEPSSPTPSFCSTTASSLSGGGSGGGVHFNETVSVVEIPSRHQYSDRIKQVLWSSRYEISENAERNLFEFSHEGYDWRNVVLDDDMYIDSVTGKLIHPCHFEDPTTRIDDDCEDYKTNDDDDDDNDDAEGFLPIGKSTPYM